MQKKKSSKKPRSLARIMACGIHYSRLELCFGHQRETVFAHDDGCLRPSEFGAWFAMSVLISVGGGAPAPAPPPGTPANTIACLERNLQYR